MQTFRRSVVLQISVFSFFFLYGLDNIIKSLVPATLIYSLIELFVLLLVLGVGFFIYHKTEKDAYVPVSQKQLNAIKYSLYAISAALIASILTTSIEMGPSLYQYLNIGLGIVIALTGVFGVYLGITIHQQK